MPDTATPAIVDRATWERERADLLVREKAHTRAGDALAAARRRLPMTRMGPVTVVGAGGPVPLHQVFEGRRMLIVYHFMWKRGAPHDKQCPGCTHTQVALNEAVRAYLAARDVAYAVFSAGPWPEFAAYRDFMGWTMPWYSTLETGDALPAIRDGGDLRCYLREGETVFQTYETTQRGVEAMLPTLRLLDLSPTAVRRAGKTRPPAGRSPTRPATGGGRTAGPWRSGRAPMRRSIKTAVAAHATAR